MQRAPHVCAQTLTKRIVPRRQDNPLMTNVADMPCIPILAFDLYEHAYFLTYYSDRVQFTVDSFQVGGQRGKGRGL